MGPLESSAAIIAAIIGATWTLRSKLSDIEKALASHVSYTSSELAALAAKIIKLEERRPGRRNHK